MKNVVSIIWFLTLLSSAISSCCPPQEKLNQAISTYLSNPASNANKNILTNIRIVNVKKFSCDSVEVFARFKSVADNGRPTERASRYTIVKKGEAYIVINEIKEE